MIKLKDWDNVYLHNIDWALRRLEPSCLEFYGDTEQEWIEVLRTSNKLKSELIKTYSVTCKSNKNRIKGLELTAEQLFELFHKYIDSHSSHAVKEFVFKWWNDLRYFVPGALPVLGDPSELMKDATKEEVEQANKDFADYECAFYGEVHKSKHTFNNGLVLEYRGIRFPIDDQWGDAWFRKKNGMITHFQLDWDYWYSIDECLDLYNI